jgi:CBS domain containing-hemolysin-like protein
MVRPVTIALLLLTAFLILGNGFFVAAEFALVKVRSTQLDVLVDEGSRSAVVARHLVEHLDGYLSATQLGITIMSLGLGWIGEPAVARLLDPVFHAVHLPEEAIHPVSIAIAFTGISFLHIVVGEVAPKSLAIARPVGVSLAVSMPMRVFYIAFYPALVVLNASANLLLKAFGIEPAGTHALAVEAAELQRITEDSVAGGQLSKEEGDLLSNVFTFSTRRANEIMVPRNRVHAIDLADPAQEALAAALEHGHSRYPLFDGSLDDIVGVLHLKDLLPAVVAGEPRRLLRDLARPPLYVPETLPAEKVMRMMQAQRIHLAVVLDEYGTVAGIVWLEDALEELVGDIQDEHDEESDEVEPIEGGFALEGHLTFDDLAGVLGVELPKSASTTLQGFLMEQLERLPRRGDTVQLGEWTLRVVELEKRAITRVEAIKGKP